MTFPKAYENEPANPYLLTVKRCNFNEQWVARVTLNGKMVNGLLRALNGPM